MLSHIITNLYVINFRLYQEYNTLSTRIQHSSYIRLNVNSLVTQCQDLLDCSRGFLWHTLGNCPIIFVMQFDSDLLQYSTWVEGVAANRTMQVDSCVFCAARSQKREFWEDQNLLHRKCYSLRAKHCVLIALMILDQNLLHRKWKRRKMQLRPNYQPINIVRFLNAVNN